MAVPKPLQGLVTHRQLDYWCRNGWLDIPAQGSGHVRGWPDGEVEVARRMALLIRAGFTPGAAAELARDAAVEVCRDLPHGSGGLSVALRFGPGPEATEGA